MLTALVLASQLGAHVHGQAELSVVQDGGAIHVRLTADLGSLVGFEHPPSNERERAAMAGAATLLESGSEIFALLPDRAGCRVENAEVSLPPIEAHDDADTDHHDAEAHYRLACDNVGQINAVSVRIFDVFPAIEAVNVIVLTDRVQAGGTASAASSEVEF